VLRVPVLRVPQELRQADARRCCNRAGQRIGHRCDSGENAYVYGPIAMDAALRGLGVAAAMFQELKRLVPGREGILFIKADNEISLRAHCKMGMRQVAEFQHAGTA
jgi:hypothetical protein